MLFFRALEGRIHDGDDLNVDSCVDVVDNDDGTMMVMVMVMMMMMVVMMMMLSFIVIMMLKWKRF